ncbi:MAG: hypothetical protein KAS71_09705 [Bacteroidales bacterium]|nr:hypothetical protein [Bacteroidales bacterium]
MTNKKYYVMFRMEEDGRGEATIYTNKRRLVEASGGALNYHTLVHHLVRKQRTWYRKGNIVVICAEGIVRGNQVLSIRGRGFH